MNPLFFLSFINWPLVLKGAIVSGALLGSYIGGSYLIKASKIFDYNRDVKQKQEEAYEQADKKTDDSISDAIRFE